MKTDELITDKQAAEILGVKPSYLAYLRHVYRHDKLTYTKQGNQVFYKKEDVERFIEEKKEKKKHSRKR